MRIIANRLVDDTRVAPKMLAHAIPPWRPLALNDPIDSRKLQIFLCLAQKGSLKAAAPELSLTNSAVSHAITSLESNLGVQLFHRSGKGLVLTERGEFLYRKAVPLFARMNNIRTELIGENPEGRTTLRIAVGFNFLGCIIPDVVREFNECFPRANLSIRAAERDSSLQLLRDREVDAAIMVEPPEDGPEFTYHKLFDDEPRLVMNSRNPLAPLEVVPMRNLAMKTLLVSRNDSHTIRILQQQMSRKGVEFREVIAVGGVTAICEMVKLGQGVALLPDWVVRHAAPSRLLVTRPIDGLRLTRTWAFVCANWTMPTIAMRTFRRLSQQAVSDFAPKSDPVESALA